MTKADEHLLKYLKGDRNSYPLTENIIADFRTKGGAFVKLAFYAVHDPENGLTHHYTVSYSEPGGTQTYESHQFTFKAAMKYYNSRVQLFASKGYLDE